jgi:hypothetical protein
MVQDHTPTSEISSTKIKRGQDRSLSMTEETTSLMACLPSRKPKERHGPPRYPDPITLIQNKYLKQLQRKNSCNSGQNLTVETIE